MSSKSSFKLILIGLLNISGSKKTIYTSLGYYAFEKFYVDCLGLLMRCHSLAAFRSLLGLNVSHGNEMKGEIKKL